MTAETALAITTAIFVLMFVTLLWLLVGWLCAVAALAIYLATAIAVYLVFS